MASASSAREFVGFPVTPIQHVVVDGSIAAAFHVLLYNVLLQYAISLFFFLIGEMIN